MIYIQCAVLKNCYNYPAFSLPTDFFLKLSKGFFEVHDTCTLYHHY